MQYWHHKLEGNLYPDPPELKKTEPEFSAPNHRHKVTPRARQPLSTQPCPTPHHPTIPIYSLSATETSAEAQSLQQEGFSQFQKQDDLRNLCLTNTFLALACPETERDKSFTEFQRADLVLPLVAAKLHNYSRILPKEEDLRIVGFF